MNELNLDFALRFLVNLTFIVILIYGCYFRRSKNHQLASSFILFGVGIFVITFTLKSAEMSMGFAFGLFAVFTMLRYRTEPISIKEMTYLFLVIAISLLSAVSQLSTSALATVNLALCITAFFVDSSLLESRYAKKKIQYEKIELIKPEMSRQLLDDLVRRTGLNIKSVEISKIDFLRDTAEITITYLPDLTIVKEIFVTDTEKDSDVVAVERT